MSKKKSHRAGKKREKQKKKRSAAAASAAEKRRAELPTGGLRNAAGWPLAECWVTGNWHQWEVEVTAIVVRRHPMGAVAAAVFEVDLAERAVVGASVVRDHAVQRTLERVSEGDAHLEQCSAAFVARLVGEAGAQSGSKSSGVKKALKLLGDADPAGSDAEFRWGYELEEADTDEKAGSAPGLMDRVKAWFGRG